MDIVTIDLTLHPPAAPLGMLLAPSAANLSSSQPTSSNVTLVAGWEHDKKENGGGRHNKLGPIQRSGLVRLGDRLVRINGKDVTDWTFREVMDALRELVVNSSNNTTTSGRRKRLKTLGFAPAGTPEWSRGTHHAASTISDSIFFGLFNNINSQSANDAPSHVVHSKRMYSFVSFIGSRWRVAHGPVSSSSLSGGSNNGQPQQEEEQRQLSDNSQNELEQRLSKEPTIKYDDDNIPIGDINDAQTPEEALNAQPSNSPTREGEPTTTATEQPYIQYEIQCHILFRDPSSFQSYTNPNSNPNNMHHSWSVWKRFSQFTTLDEELRRDFGWQMDALDDGRGVVFPSLHGLESWWYGPHWWSSITAVGDDDGNAADEGENCPFPTSFIEKRQKELTSYWTNLMRVEDIFEFGDMQSHKFGKTMAAFLEVDRVLLSRKNATMSSTGTLLQQRQSPLTSKLAFPATINEDEMLGPSFQPLDSLPLLPPTREVPEATREIDSGMLNMHDDDVSILSDGTGAFGDMSKVVNGSPLRGRQPVVDIVPKHISNGTCAVGDSEANNNGVMGNQTPEKQVRSPSSIASSSAASGGRRRGKAVPKAKPAFQRQFMTP